jgi:hypothetical protein
MKTKEEIEQLAELSYPLKNDIYKDLWSENKSFIKGYSQCQQDMADTSKVTRFEVIDENGRAYTQRDCKVELSYQDDGRTLKVFIKPLNKQD